jgi:hypothetical protein
MAELSNGNRGDYNKLYIPQIALVEERTPELGLEPGIFYPRTKPRRDRAEAMGKPQNMDTVSRCQLIENAENIRIRRRKLTSDRRSGAR